MSGNYDKIIKENLRELVGTIIKVILGIKSENIVQLDPKFQITDEREADFIFKVGKDKYNEASFILHLEFQSTNDYDIIYRMFRYFGLIHKTYKLEVKQYLFYIGQDKIRMQNILEQPKVYYEYNLIDFKEIDVDNFLASENIEEIILSILCRFDKQDSATIVRKILNKLKESTKEETILLKYIRQLEIISKLRNLQEIVSEEEEKMSLVYDMETDIRFKQGIERGIERGIEKGMKRGIEKGMKRGMKKERLFVIKNLLSQNVDIKIIAQVTELSIDEIMKIKFDIDGLQK